MPQRKVWMYCPKPVYTKFSPLEKKELEDIFAPLIQQWRGEYIQEPTEVHNYRIEIYSKWVGNSFYLCDIYHCPYPNRISDQFENKLFRFRHIKNEGFEFAYMRYNDQWHVLHTGVPKEGVLDMATTYSYLVLH